MRHGCHQTLAGAPLHPEFRVDGRAGIWLPATRLVLLARSGADPIRSAVRRALGCATTSSAAPGDALSGRFRRALIDRSFGRAVRRPERPAFRATGASDRTRPEVD